MSTVVETTLVQKSTKLTYSCRDGKHISMQVTSSELIKSWCASLIIQCLRGFNNPLMEHFNWGVGKHYIGPVLTLTDPRGGLFENWH